MAGKASATNVPCAVHPDAQAAYQSFIASEERVVGDLLEMDGSGSDVEGEIVAEDE